MSVRLGFLKFSWAVAILQLGVGAPWVDMVRADDPADAAPTAEAEGEEPKKEEEPAKDPSPTDLLGEVQKLLRSPLKSPEAMVDRLNEIIATAEKVLAHPEAMAQDKEQAYRFMFMPLARGQMMKLEGFDKRLRDLVADLKKNDPKGLATVNYAAHLVRIDEGLLDQKLKSTTVDAVKKFVEEYSEQAEPCTQLLSDLAGAAESTGATAEALAALMLIKEKFPKSNAAENIEADLRRLDAIGKPFPFEGTLVNGGPLDVEALKGKVVVIDFWATWCGPCIAEFPRMKKMYADLHDKGLEIVGVSLDNEKAELEDFLKKEELPWVQVFPAEGEEIGWASSLPRKWGINAIPRLFLVDQSGVLVATSLRGEPLEEKVRELLKVPAASSSEKPTEN